MVIKIPDTVYQGILNANNAPGKWDNTLLGTLCKGVANGKPLPKGHDIIDGTELNKYLDDLIYAEQNIRLDGYETRTDIIERIKIKADFLTIIEADKESK